MKHTRREFVRKMCRGAVGLSAASAFSRLGLLSTRAQGAPGYKALVCVFLSGGNDANNMLVPTDPAGYTNYQSIRGALSSGGIALDQSSLLPITPKTAQNGSTLFGLHPQLPDLQFLFNSGKLAWLANVGTLVSPITRAQYLANSQPAPANLFSHSDQQQEWQTSDSSGLGTTGWGGRVADEVLTAFNAAGTFPAMASAAGNAIFGNGQNTQLFGIVPGTLPGLGGFDNSAASTARLVSLQQMLTLDTQIPLVQAASSITTNALTQSQTLSAAIASAGAINTPFPVTAIGQQMFQIAKLIQVRSALGLNRQIFFASLGGFDTHAGQIATQATLFSQLSPALIAFYNSTLELGVSASVTTFTMSEFGRTFQPASGGGTDHGWGSVQMILGDAVFGGDIYGKLPTFSLGGPDDAGSDGRWIPTAAVDQYAATLATWFGVGSTNLAAIFPNLTNFTTPNLGFLG